MTMRAIWNGVVVAESDDTVVVEGNHYFPKESLFDEYLVASKTRSVCPWKGLATYHSLTVDGVTNVDAAWGYQHPFPLARRIKGRVAFWRGVEVVSGDDATNRAE